MYSGKREGPGGITYFGECFGLDDDVAELHCVALPSPVQMTSDVWYGPGHLPQDTSKVSFTLDKDGRVNCVWYTINEEPTPPARQSGGTVSKVSPTDNTLHVANLHEMVKQIDLANVFQKFGEIRVIRFGKQSANGTKVAFVEFTDHPDKSANAACQDAIGHSVRLFGLDAHVSSTRSKVPVSEDARGGSRSTSRAPAPHPPARSQSNHNAPPARRSEGPPMKKRREDDAPAGRGPPVSETRSFVVLINRLDRPEVAYNNGQPVALPVALHARFLDRELPGIKPLSADCYWTVSDERGILYTGPLGGIKGDTLRLTECMAQY